MSVWVRRALGQLLDEISGKYLPYDLLELVFIPVLGRNNSTRNSRSLKHSLNFFENSCRVTRSEEQK
jgi:hypothetical protein